MKKFVIYLVVLFSTLEIFAQTDTTFWFVIPRITPAHYRNPATPPAWPGAKPAYFRVTNTSDAPTNVRICTPANMSRLDRTKTLGPFATDTFTMDNYILSLDLINTIENTPSDNLNDKGIKITSSNGNITVYYDSDEVNNMDIFSLKGKNAIGKKFVVPGQSVWGNHVWTSANNKALQRIDIVSTKAGITTVRVTPRQNIFKNPASFYPANVPFNITFTGEGQTYSLTATSELASAHIGGTILEVLSGEDDRKIAVTISDDSDETGGNYATPPGTGCGCYDLQGDQVIPVDVLGQEYIVMRGMLKTVANLCSETIPPPNSNTGEYAFIYAVNNGTSIYIDGVFKQSINAGACYIDTIRNNSSHIRSQDALHPLAVLHSTGFGCEGGAAVIPTIDGCTGSLSVVVTRSRENTDPDGFSSFYMNLMTSDIGRKHIYVEYLDASNVWQKPAAYNPIPQDSFKQVASRPDWYVLSPYYKQMNFIPKDRPVRVYTNEKGDRFHLGIINGGSSSGCKYGYFSDFRKDEGGCFIGNTTSEIYDGCYEDTIFFHAHGGLSYKWRLRDNSGNIIPENYLNNDTIANPFATPPPSPSTGYNYEVLMNIPCIGLDSFTVKVAIAPQIISSFDADKTYSCSPNTSVTFTNNSCCGNNLKYYWDVNSDNILDRTTFNRNPQTFVYPTNTTKLPITYTAMLNVVDTLYTSCIASSIKKITIYPEVNASFTVDPTTPTIGCDSLPVSFKNNSGGDTCLHSYQAGYLWDFDNGNTFVQTDSAALVSQVFRNQFKAVDDTFDVKLIATSHYSCRDTFTLPVIVHPELKAFFTIDTASICAPDTIRFQNNSTGTITNYNWDFGNGTLSEGSLSDHNQPYVNNGALATPLNARLVVSNSGGLCTDAITRPITIYPMVNANFTYPPIASYCNPVDVNFTNPVNNTSVLYSWEFGDGTSSIQNNPNHTFENFSAIDDTFNTQLIVASEFYPCWATHNTDIIVYPYFKAGFAIDSVQGCTGMSTNITDNWVGPITRFVWDYGDLFPNDTFGTGYLPQQNNFDHTYVQPINSIDTTYHTLSLIAYNNHNCSDVDSVKITVYPRTPAQGPFVSSVQHCAPYDFTFLNTTTKIPGDKFLWTFSDGTSSTDDIVTHTFNNNTGSLKTDTVLLTATSVNNCVSTTSPMLIHTKPFVKADFNRDKSQMCTYDTLFFNDLSSVATGASITNRYWYRFGNPTYDELNPGLNFFRNDYTNNTIIPDTINIKLRVENNFNCSDSITRPFIIFPRVTSGFTPLTPITGCNPLDITFENTSDTLVSKFFTWDFGDGTTSSLDSVPHRYTNITSSFAPYNGSFTTRSIYNCYSTTPFSITVWEYLKADFTVDPTKICSGVTLDINNASLGNASHNFWDFGDGISLADMNKSDTSHTYTYQRPNIAQPDSIIYNLKLRVENDHACFDSIIKPITVYSEVLVNITPDTVRDCNPLPVDFSITPPSITANYYNWNFGDGSTSSDMDPAPHIYENRTPNNLTDTVILTAYSTHNCVKRDTSIITTYALTEADFTVQNAEICSDTSITFIENSRYNIGSRVWDFGNGPGSDSGTFTHPYSNITDTTQNHTVSLTVRNLLNLCPNTKTETIKVYPRITSAFNIVGPTSVCDSTTVGFTNTTNLSGNTYTWLFDDGSTSAAVSPNHTFFHTLPTTKPYTIRLSAMSKELCPSDTYKVLNVYPYIDADFKVPIPEICADIPVAFVDTSRGGITTRRWDYGDGSPIITNPAVPIHPFTNAGPGILYPTVQLTVSHGYGTGCPDIATHKITVFPKVTANISIPTKGGCSPFTPTINGAGSLNENIYNWTLGEASSPVDNPVHTFYNYTDKDDTVDIRLIAVSNYLCSDTAFDQIFVHHMPKAQFYSDSSMGCPPFNVTFHNTSITSNSSYLWNYGDGVTAAIATKNDVSHSFNYTRPDNTIQPYTVTLRATSIPGGCVNTSTSTINVYPTVNAEYIPIVSDCSPIIVDKLQNLSTNAIEYLWDFGDGITSTLFEPTYSFENLTGADKPVTVKLRATSLYKCFDDVSHNFTIYPSPTAMFGVAPAAQKFPNATFTLDNQTNPGPFNYWWTFDDGEESLLPEPIQHTYAHWGVYTIRLEVVNPSHTSCRDSVFQTVDLQPPLPIALFDSLISGCVPLVVDFYNDSTLYASDYYWNFGDGTLKYDSIQAPTSHEYIQAGEYNVELYVKGDGGEDRYNRSVSVYPKPFVNFNVAPDIIQLPKDSMICYNKTEGAVSYLWDFGDGAFSDEINPYHIYSDTGFYNITLTATSEYNCVNTYTLPSAIYVTGNGVIRFPNAFTPSLTGSKGKRYDSSDPTNANNVFIPLSQSVAEYKLEIYDRWGELLFTSTDVNEGWDGYYKGKLCPQGVYVYKAKGRFYSGRTFMKSGDITLLHRKK
jgi:gliding motility-associated-like protein